LLNGEAAQLVCEAIAPGEPIPQEEIDLPADDCFPVKAKKIPLNPRLVFGEWMGEPVRVRVPDSKKFVPGMQMRCRKIEGDLYELVGRGPRYKGKW
jgi:hypothetical protein